VADTKTDPGSAATSWEMSDGISGGLGTSRYKEYELAPYAQVVRARIPAAIWSGVLFSWLSLKGHVQGMWQFDRTQLFATELPDGTVEATFVVAWQGAETLTEWLQGGFSTEIMLHEMGISDDDVEVRLMRDFS
jgi:hypothetical protein